MQTSQGYTRGAKHACLDATSHRSQDDCLAKHNGGPVHGKPPPKMASQSYSSRHISSDVSVGQCLAAAAAMVSSNPSCNEMPICRRRPEPHIYPLQIIAYCIGRAIYNVHFHPLAKYPGPNLAAITDAWWAYSRY